MNYSKWLNDNVGELKDKTILITGSTGALGTETVYGLAFLGASLIFVDRNQEKSNKLKTELKEKFPNLNVSNYVADMSNIESVKNVCNELKEKKVDVIILNAGAYKANSEKLGDYSSIFQINFISPYLFAKNMLQNNPEAKVVVVGSLAHKFAKFNQKDIDYLKNGSGFKIYGNSKRWLMYAIKKLCDKNGYKYSIVHPGISLTNLMTGFPKFVYLLIKYPMRLVFMKPKKACLSIVKGVTDETKGKFWIGPKIFGVWGTPRKTRLKIKDEELELIFNNTEDIYNKNSPIS